MCSLLFYLSICVAMVDAHKVEQGARVCPRLMVVLTQTLFVWAAAFIFSDHKGKYFHRPEDVSSVNGCFNPNSVWAVCFTLLDHEDKWF